ncbi:uncharacterized protein RSE6_03900 [Rhynchosporium secalis]|uniref:Uncharacterized protein n=1 Tax=Rhynchosporium secalis TaxID=38038 RepID=A0A1E1M3W9_RHYSE|nr:uncharacterized protein RSE6_03900 [Rhynchosporium secalis]
MRRTDVSQGSEMEQLGTSGSEYTGGSSLVDEGFWRSDDPPRDIEIQQLQQSIVTEALLESDGASGTTLPTENATLIQPAVPPTSNDRNDSLPNTVTRQSITPETSLGDRHHDEEDVQEALLALPAQTQCILEPIERRPDSSGNTSIRYSTVPESEVAELPESETIIRTSSTSSRAVHPANSKQPLWIPYALEWPWMLGIIAFGIMLLVIVIVFHSISSETEGAMDDTESSSAYFAWHFLPTLLAVTYSIMLMIIQDAVKRTEGLARLANVGGASASASILRTPGPWWSAFVDSFPRQGNGSRFSPAMFSVVVAYILGFLIISPFSGALLSSKELMMSMKTAMVRVQPASGQVMRPRLDTSEFYAAIGHTFQNVGISPWITDTYTVLPFWPANIKRPTGSSFDTAAGDWTAKTSVYQTNLLCEDMRLVGGPNHINYTYDPKPKRQGLGFDNITSLKFASDSGCRYGVSHYEFSMFSTYDEGMFYWSNVTGVNINTFLSAKPWPFNELFLNHTTQCDNSDIFLTVLNRPFNSSGTGNAASYEVAGKVCRQSYFEAKLPVTVSIGAGSTTFQFDQDDFQRSRIPIDSNNINITAFHEAFFSSSWDDYLRYDITPSRINFSRPILGGPANILGAGYNFKIPGMLQDPEFAAKASKIKQHTFGLALHAAIQNITAVTGIEGEIRTRQRRIVVAPGVAITLEIVLGLATILLLVTFWTTRLHRRLLGLSQDIGIPNTVASLIAAQCKSSHDLQEISGMSVTDARYMLAGYSYTIGNGNLQMSPSTPRRSITPFVRLTRTRNMARTRWEPLILSTWAIVGFIFVLTALLAAISFLYWYSRNHGLYQSGFVYEASWSIGELGAIAPYSIIPTLIAVVVGLWWDAIDVSFRTAQPFVSMTKGPTIGRNGSALSYQSSYLAWAGLRAIKRRHWLLAFVSTGAFLSQIFAISMSALWQREPIQRERAVEVLQPFQIRDVPFVYDRAYTGRNAEYARKILGTAFQSLQTNWLYSASLQLSVNASQPTWSSEGWSFVPVYVPTSSWKAKQKSNSSSDEAQANRAVVKVNVPAMRGRLECSTIAKDLEDRFWLTKMNLTMKGYYNETLRPRPWKTGYELGCLNNPGGRASGGINFSPNMTANFTDAYGSDGNCSSTNAIAHVLTQGRLTCCAQEVEHQPDNASIGQWSPVEIDAYPPGWKYKTSTDNFTVKWIHGPAPVNFPVNWTDGAPVLVWPEPPKLSMLNCAPFVEVANASVTVDLETGNVQHYSILGKPIRHAEAFSDNFVQRTYGNSSTFNVSVSFGTIFVASLLGAAQLLYIGGCSSVGSPDDCNEDSSDRTFSYRAPGLNLDYMSYSMLKMAGDDQASLLNHNKLQELAEITFTTYFQHYASQNVLMNGSGGRAFQRANETLAADMGPPAWAYDATKVGPARVKVAVSPTTMASVSQPVEMLHMSPTAVWLCLVILIWLIITMVAVLALKKRYFSPLLGGVETIADVAMMVAGSDRYLELARREGATGMRADKSFRTKLGWFRIGGGEVRWGIELADDDTVHFLSDEEVSLLYAGHGAEEEHERATVSGGSGGLATTGRPR